MRTFICAVSTFALILALVALNGAGFSRTADSIVRKIDEAADAPPLSDERCSAVAEIEKILYDNYFETSLTVGHDETTALFAYVSDAKHQAFGDDGQFLSALDKLRREIERLRKTECFSLDGLF